jgi:large subunit ribosomal protein L13Ae
MLPHTKPKGAAALGRLKCYDGVPLSMNTKKKMVIPDALKAVRLRPRSKYSVLGNIAKECGWTKQDLIDSLETKRISKNRTWYKKRIDSLKKQRGMMKSNKDIQQVNKQLADYGY